LQFSILTTQELSEHLNGVSIGQRLAPAHSPRDFAQTPFAQLNGYSNGHPLN